MQFGGQYELIHRTLFKIAYRFQNVQQIDVSTINDYYPNLEEAILLFPTSSIWEQAIQAVKALVLK